MALEYNQKAVEGSKLGTNGYFEDLVKHGFVRGPLCMILKDEQSIVLQDHLVLALQVKGWMFRP